MSYEDLSNQILDVSLDVKSGETVWINGWEHTKGLTAALARGCRRRGCEAVSSVQSDGTWFRSITGGPKAALSRLSAEQSRLLNMTDHFVFILGPSSPIDWDKIPPDRRRLVTRWFLERNPLVEEWMAIARRRRVKMLGVEAALATPERARALDLDYRTWRRVMHSGCLADLRALRRATLGLSLPLRGRARARVTSPNGTDLTFRLDQRAVRESDGVVTDEKAKGGVVEFLPAGWVGTTVGEESAEGTIVYDGSISFPRGRVEGLILRLDSGRIVSRRAASGAEAFESFISSAGRNSDRLGFLGIGLNPQLRPGFTQDDKVLGSVELNFGENRSKGGRSRGEGNWWGTVRKATITVGSCKILDNGLIMPFVGGAPAEGALLF